MIKLVLVVTVPQSLIFFEGQIAHFKKSGIQTEIVCSPGDELTRFCEINSIIGHSIKIRRNISPLHDLWSLIEMVFLFRKIKPSIVHSGTPKGGLLGMLASYLLGIESRIYTIHGLRFETLTGWKRRIVAFFESLSCKFATKVLAVSPSLKTLAVKENICPSNKIIVLLSGSCNGVDHLCKFNPFKLNKHLIQSLKNEFNINPTNFVIGFVGRLVKDKGIDDLISAWLILKGRNRFLKLLLIGDYEKANSASCFTKMTIREDNDIIHINSTSMIENYYALMNLFVLPTYREGFGNVLIEASAMKLPVITTNVTGARDAVIHNVTGVHITVGNVTMLVDAIQSYINNKSLIVRQSQAGRQRAISEFDSKLMHEALSNFYKTCLE